MPTGMRTFEKICCLLFLHRLQVCVHLWQLDRSLSLPPPGHLLLQVPMPCLLLSKHLCGMSYLGTTLTLNYIISYGAEGGVRNRLQCSLGTTMPRQVEYPTSYEHPKVVDRLLATECKLDRVLGPLQPPPPPPPTFPALHQLVWSDPKEVTARKMVTDCEPVLFGGCQHQRQYSTKLRLTTIPLHQY